MAGSHTPSRIDTRRRFAAAWCFLAVLAAVVLPGVHGVQVVCAAGGCGEHACHCEHGDEEGGKRGEAPSDHRQQGDDACPVCRVIHLASGGGVPAWEFGAVFVTPVVRRDSIAPPGAPALAWLNPQVTLRGPPAV